jgi:hypothetical protein
MDVTAAVKYKCTSLSFSDLTASFIDLQTESVTTRPLGTPTAGADLAA